MRTFIISLSVGLVALVFASTETPGQRTAASKDVEVEILKAEDSRNFDSIKKLLVGCDHCPWQDRAILAAGRIGDARALPYLVDYLEHGLGPYRAAAAFAVGEIESLKSGDALKAADALISVMEDPRPELSFIRARAVEAAGKLVAANPNEEKSTKLTTAILDVLEAEHTKGAKADRETVLLGLTAALRAASRDAKRARPDRTDTVVARFLTDPDARVRADAANTLARVRAKNANDILQKMVVSDFDAVARANAARALAAAENKSAVDVLIKSATTDVDGRVRVSAIRALAALRDVKAADPLLARGEVLFATYKKAKKPGFIPAEQNEFIEIATALGRLLTNTRNERAVNLFREFGKLDLGFATEVYIARLRIAPGRGDADKPELTHWRQHSTLGQVVGEFSTLEPTSDEGKRMKNEAPDVLRPLAKAYAEADPVAEADTIKAAPDVIRAYAGFKTADLPEILRMALTNKDLFVRATAAELIAEQPVSDENLSALNKALEYAIVNDTQYDDAVLATLDALFKLDKRKSLPALELAAGSLDHLVRAKVLDLLKDEEFRNKDSLSPMLKNLDVSLMRQLRPYSGKYTKVGQVLNTDADYARAIARKNGTVRAIVTTQKGAFTIDFLPEDAPLTVDNFIKLARSGYFNGLEVHRVVSNFVMQDGDPRGDGNGGPGWSIRCEMNMVPYERGAVGMALSGKDTGGSQWFVTHSRQPHLDGGYTVFGRVNETGMKVVDKIVRGDKILSVRIVETAVRVRGGRSRNRER